MPKRILDDRTFSRALKQHQVFLSSFPPSSLLHIVTPSNVTIPYRGQPSSGRDDVTIGPSGFTWVNDRMRSKLCIWKQRNVTDEEFN